MKRTCAFALVVIGLTPIVTADAQQSLPARQDPATAQPAARPIAKGPAIDGIWSGTLTQVAGGAATKSGGESKYAIVLTITAKGAESVYPELGCHELRLFCGSDHSWPGRERGALPGWYHHPDTRGRKHRFEMVRHFSERAHSCLGYARAESWTITIVWRSAVLVYPRKLGPFRTVLGPASRRRPRWRRGRKIG